MGRKARRRLRPLAAELSRAYPDLQDPAAERVNLGDLDTRHVPEAVQLITVDLSYLAVNQAASQIEQVRIDPGADLIALVKPMFELGLPAPPAERSELSRAVERAAAGLEAAGWSVLGSIRSPVTGARGAVEFLVHARRS